MPDPNAAAYAADVPVYVRAVEGGHELRDSASDESLGTYARLRDALDAALAELSVDGHSALKAPVLHDGAGEPNGAWRWFPAATEEAGPNEEDGLRLSARNIWTF